MVNLEQALLHPDKILFLDIETTGLSRYYDQVTVIGYDFGGKFHYHLQGDDLSHFEKTLSKAYAIVTFNGTIFDVKFLQHHFPHLKFPEHHIDLRYLMRRVGYAGGQKLIEVLLGMKRAEDIKGVTGYEAVVLWHEYRRGNEDSLRKLLAYNHADVQGMKYMLSFALDKTSNVPKLIFEKTENPRIKTRAVKTEKPKPKVYAKDLWKKIKKPHGPIIGIDLTGSELRPSGFAILNGYTAETRQCLTDKEMIKLCREAKPMLVSIDSPLGIPKGRKTCFDDDPTRYEIGIMRWAERELKRRGVNVYPCLIPSMQRLTNRGMKLAKALRKHGIKVIESYPGAAQDIMQIPRKQAGLPYLKDGLREFGIDGFYHKNIVSHDEIDAITSAIVGLFYLAGNYEALGNDDEEYLVIPKI
ncbi:MAG: ribonuclease H-like domain-containing protein [Candidatus Paceibacterota bacterium]